MASIFNWLGVLLQRLYDVYPDVDDAHQQHAIVLIDEIDSHLHPDWQRRLVELAKKHFPKIQVVATSHSPLLAGALRKEELCVVSRDTEGRITIQSDLDLFGFRTQDILRSPAFNLTSDRAPEAEREIEQYFAAYEKVEKSPDDEAIIAGLGPRLDAIRFGKPPSDPLAALTPSDVEQLRSLFPPRDDDLAGPR